MENLETTLYEDLVCYIALRGSSMAYTQLQKMAGHSEMGNFLWIPSKLSVLCTIETGASIELFSSFF